MAAKEDESYNDTITISRKKYEFLCYCQDIVMYSVRNNAEVIQMTKEVCDKLGLSDDFKRVYEPKPRKKAGRPKKNKKGEDE